MCGRARVRVNAHVKKNQCTHCARVHGREVGQRADIKIALPRAAGLIEVRPRRERTANEQNSIDFAVRRPSTRHGRALVNQRGATRTRARTHV